VRPTPEVTFWIAQQCQGLASAVKRIHGLATWQLKMQSSSYSVSSEAEKTRGRHGDIKPSNILWFKKREGHCNLLVLSDLGLTRYHSELTNSLVSHIPGSTSTHRAPEVDTGCRISQRYDIWSLGCVFLEFCVWYLQGWDGLERFEDDRQMEKVSKGFITDGYYSLIYSKSGEKRAEVKRSVYKVTHHLTNRMLRIASNHY
jgi:serine/threonine protein kinase